MVVTESNFLAEQAQTISGVAAVTSQPELVKGLGLFDSTMIVCGSMIGSGIFIVSADIAQQVRSPALLLSVWVIAGIMTVIGADRMDLETGHRRSVAVLVRFSRPL
jgi:L-asparagine transporter-like permease